MSREYAPSWLAVEAATGGRTCLQGSVPQMRAMNDQMVAALASSLPPFPENVGFADESIEGVPVRIYTPKSSTGPLPTGLWTHAGGYVFGNMDQDHFTCAIIAEQTNSAIINIDYRLAPETKWPGQLDDCMKVYRWAHANAHSFGGDNTRLYTMGGSAGGGLAFQIANQVVVDPQLKSSLKGIIAMVPVTAHWGSVPDKYRSKYTSVEENAKDVPIIDRGSLEVFFDATAADPKDASLFTILSENKKLFPPTYLTSCGMDPIRDDAFIMEEALKEAGVPVKHDHYAGFPHYFWIFPGVPEAQTYMANLLAGIKWVQSQI